MQDPKIQAYRQRPGAWLEMCLLFVLLCCAAAFVVRTRHWPLVGDAPLMHYVVFLISHGMAPYREIVDINMPGTYAIQALAIHLFGGGATGWRILDLLLCGLLTAAMIEIARPYSWFAGAFAGGIFTLLHGRNGLVDTGQRDLFISVLVLFGYVFLFRDLEEVERKRNPLWAVMLFALCIGIAATVKPTVLPLGPALLILAALARSRKNLPFTGMLAAGTICLALPWGVVFLYLLHEHAVSGFFVILFHLIPQHAYFRRRPGLYLVRHCISSVILPLVVLWLPVAYFRKPWRTWQGAALLIGVLMGFVSFYVQRKGYAYHRYPSETLLLLLIGLDLSMALKDSEAGLRAPVRALAALGLAYGVLVIGTGSTVRAVRYNWRNDEFDTMLQADLNHLGGQKLNGQVQCLDMAVGCLNVLYRMKLLQDTGYLYDCYLFMPPRDSTVAWLRERFLDEIRSRPPEVFVVTSHQCSLAPMNYRYDELREWPDFDSFLTRNYTLYADRIPPDKVYWIGKPRRPFGYRIYVRRVAAQ